MNGDRKLVSLTGMAALLALLWLPAAATALSASEENGRTIYFKGEDAAGKKITALFGKDLVEMNGGTARCSGCHGSDGLGRPESGVVPLNIRWKNLVKTYGHLHPDESGHGQFTEHSLKSYLRDGIYPGGLRGDSSMPVYDIDDAALDDLLAYMRLIGTAADPGVDDTAIRIGLVAAKGEESAVAAEETIRAYFGEINEQGGIYRRRLLIEVLGSGPGDNQSKTFGTIELGSAAGLFSADADSTAPVPMISLFPPDLHANGTVPDHVFALLPGLREQAFSLVSFAAGKLIGEANRFAVIFPSEPEISGIAESLFDLSRQKGMQGGLKIEYRQGSLNAAEAFAHMKQAGADRVIFLGSPRDTALFLKSAEGELWLQAVLLPGQRAGSAPYAASRELQKKIYLAYPSIPGGADSDDLAQFRQFSKRHNLSSEHLWLRTSSYAAAKVFVEGLRRSGRELSREKFTAMLNSLKDYRTGSLRPLTFAGNRRVGLSGAYLVTPAPEELKGIRSLGWFSAQ